MQALYDVCAPAKLNLFLHVTGRRADGYHLIQSVFMLIDWCDTLHFEIRTDGRLSREDLTVTLPDNDLVMQAATALQRYAACPLGVHVGVHKAIPAQAGMGGGSSDAASCLLALNRLWKLHLPLATLQAIGLKLGADVPFFLGGHNAWVEGVGDKITPLADEAVLPNARFAVIKPSAGLPTAHIFSSPHLKRDTKSATILSFAAMREQNEKFKFGCNDLQAVAQAQCPEVSQALGVLTGLGLQGRMTGSGSAVFAYLDSSDSQTVWSKSLPDCLPNNWESRVCSNLPVHPLMGWAGSDIMSVST